MRRAFVIAGALGAGVLTLAFWVPGQTVNLPSPPAALDMPLMDGMEPLRGSGVIGVTTNITLRGWRLEFRDGILTRAYRL